MKIIFCLAAAATMLTPCMALDGEKTPRVMTSTDWRDDEKNLPIVREVNRAYERLPFSREYEGVMDHCPVRLAWSVGPNLPVPWKGGVAGVVGDQVIMAGGLWMPERKNLAFAFSLKSQTYKAVPPPPFETAYTQGACDGKSVYIVGGRAAGRKAARLHRRADGEWQWTLLPALPESEGAGRWLAVANLIPGRWLFLSAGHPTGTPSEIRERPPLPDWRLRLDDPNAQWTPMASYPGGPRALLSSAVARGKLYVFGGSHPDPIMRSIFTAQIREHGLFIVPYGGVPQYRDAYRYDPDANQWQPIRRLPFPMGGGAAITLDDRYILLMGETETKSTRMGKTNRPYLTKLSGGAKGDIEPFWTGYGDVILCYDIEADNYSRVGVMPYGVATCPWVSDGKQVYGFGGEPYHGFNMNTENVLQIGVIEKVK